MEVVALITRPDGGVDGQLYHLLSTSIDLDGLYDLLEADNVARSWKVAGQVNIEEARERE